MLLQLDFTSRLRAFPKNSVIVRVITVLPYIMVYYGNDNYHSKSTTRRSTECTTRGPHACAVNGTVTQTTTLPTKMAMSRTWIHFRPFKSANSTTFEPFQFDHYRPLSTTVDHCRLLSMTFDYFFSELTHLYLL